MGGGEGGGEIVTCCFLLFVFVTSCIHGVMRRVAKDARHGRRCCIKLLPYSGRKKVLRLYNFSVISNEGSVTVHCKSACLCHDIQFFICFYRLKTGLDIDHDDDMMMMMMMSVIIMMTLTFMYVFCVFDSVSPPPPPLPPPPPRLLCHLL